MGNILARVLKIAAKVEPHEVRAVLLSMLFFFLLLGSYYIVRPVRDAMGTVWGADDLEQLFTGTLLASLIVSPLYAWAASRFKLSQFLPWVYGLIAASIVGFYFWFESMGEVNDRWVAASFYVWVSTFNLLIISVFWSFMADLFARVQAKRLFGFVAAGGTAGGLAGPALVAAFGKDIGNNNLMLISAVGFGLTALLVRTLAAEKARLVAAGGEVQQTTLDHRLEGGMLDGFKLLLRSRYLLLLALFLLLMTWISTIVYIQLGKSITANFADREQRTQAYALIDLLVNGVTVFVQLFGTSRFVQRFGVTTGLLLNPVIMVVAFLGIAFSPVLIVLGTMQVIRRVAEYAVAKPTREMLFTVVDQESRYKAKNVIDTVVYRFGDWSASWVANPILAYGIGGLAVFGAIIAALWFPVAWMLGRRYESIRSG